jgi:DNA-binding response OmpR family regulator
MRILFVEDDTIIASGLCYTLSRRATRRSLCQCTRCKGEAKDRQL